MDRRLALEDDPLRGPAAPPSTEQQILDALSNLNLRFQDVEAKLLS